jgi:hypothetical protein
MSGVRLCHALGWHEEAEPFRRMAHGVWNLANGVVPPVFEVAPKTPASGARKPTEYNNILVLVSSYVDALKKTGLEVQEASRLVASILQARGISIGKSDTSLNLSIINARNDISACKHGDKLYRQYESERESLRELVSPYGREQQRELLLSMLKAEIDQAGPPLSENP